MKKWLSLVVLSFLFVGCNSGIKDNGLGEKTSTQKVITAEGETMQYSVITQGSYPLDIQAEKETRVFHSDDATEVAAFEEAYMALTQENAPSFDGVMVIAKMGEQSTGGYAIDVEEVKDSGRFVELTLRESKPDGIATMALSNPYLVVFMQTHKDIKIITK